MTDQYSKEKRILEFFKKLIFDFKIFVVSVHAIYRLVEGI